MPSSLSDCFKKESGNLITDFITVKVVDVLPLINYKKQSGEHSQMFTAAICDATYACIAKVYDSEKVTTILPNQVLILENFFIRDGEISITNRTHVYRTGGPLTVPDDIMDKASYLLTGTEHTDKSPTSIVDAAISPRRTLLSVKGTVYKTNAIEKKTIRSTGEEVSFRRLKIKDETSKICVVLWRELAEEPFTTNEVVQFNNFQVSDTFGTDGKAVPSITNKLSSASIQRLPSDSINTDITESDDDVLSSSPKGLLLRIADLKMYKCCINERCYKRKLRENRCSSCGLSYTDTSAGSGFVGKILVKTDNEVNTFTVFTQQVEQLCKLLDCTTRSTSLESDIAHKLPVNITFQKIDQKITKIIV